MPDEQSGNLTGLYLAEETSLKVLPATPVWYEREPNSYGDFGGNYAMTTRKPIKHDRQHTKGEVSDNDPTANWQEDLTPNNMIVPMQGFMWADKRAKPSTTSTAAAASSDTYTVASSTGFAAGSLVFASGFDTAANNGLHVVASVGAGTVVVGNGLVDESGATATVEVIGFQFDSGDLSLTAAADSVTLTSATVDMTTFGFVLGEWAFVGGDATGLRFADSGNNAPFYGRISEIAETYIKFDKTTGTQATNAGTGKTIQVFFGTVIKNESDCSLIKRKSYTAERVYGCGATAESEYVSGLVANQITITMPQPGADAKLTVDLAFIGMSSGEYTAAERTAGNGLLSAQTDATVVASRNEEAFKPGLDVYQSKLAVVDATTLNPTSLVGYVSDGTIVINNNVTANKALAVFGNFSATPGEYTVTGSLNAFWTSVSATRAVRQGSECTYHVIATKSNAAVIFDIASLGLGNGRATVEANTPVKLPLDTAAGEGANGYTLLTNFLRYVPTVGMANA